MTEPRSSRSHSSAGDFEMSSADGALTMRIDARPFGITVQRTEVQAGNRRFTQLIPFETEDEFVRWCHSDVLWFEYPLLFSELTRRGSELFGAMQ